MGGDERRREPRVRAIRLIEVGELSNIGILANLTIGRTTDLSQSGLGLELSHELPVESKVNLDLELGEALIRILAKVRSTGPSEESRFRMGMEFLSMSELDRAALDKFLDFFKR